MRKYTALGLNLCICIGVYSQPVPNEIISRQIAAYKTDIRGPYKEIRWYCPDGSIIPPNERCPEPGGVQRARHKDEVSALAESNHIYLGQILATTHYPEFWDEDNYHSRLKQYQLEKYLRAADNGWVLRRAQFYRGAYQAEDEEQWGINFFHWLLTKPQAVEKQFFLVREAAKDIPHQGDDNTKQNIRLLSKEISDAYAPFLDIRVKIHGQPEASDIQKVKQFRDAHKARMPETLLGKMDMLLKDLEKQYQAFDISDINPYLSLLPDSSFIYGSLKDFQLDFDRTKDPSGRIPLLSSSLYDIRKAALRSPSARAKLALLDVSIVLEDLLFKEVALFKPEHLYEQIQIIGELGKAATACGYLELWEWEQLKARLDVESSQGISEAELYRIFEVCRSIPEWGTGMFMAVYEDVTALYAGFEPLANGFVDEKVRSSLLLQIGIALNELGEDIAGLLPVSNNLLGISGTSSVRGLNPGIARGELVVISDRRDDLVFEKDHIYIFERPPPDLKPVAGIASVSEGNPVSHIQLLARNLGIPNALISSQILDQLKQYNGHSVFYAVSSRGVVVMKSQDSMTSQETTLFEVKKREETRIRIPVDQINLQQKRILSLTRVDAGSSGKVCGPKAANLGQLKKMFPEHVVEGLVIPFGIFREHLDQPMSGQNLSYWAYLNRIFETSAAMREKERSEEEIEAYILKELGIFQAAVKKISLSEKFVAELEHMFRRVFNDEIGSVPVFLRSDTNMEDLKDFTGAGLNLTLFNVISPEAILQGIRDVWASPYTERSYKWRQRYLLNPENVFPSILIIPSVDVDYSGVVVTKGVGQGSSDDLTLAFNLGAGGAVDGQAAEAYLLQQDDKNLLISPARETRLRSLPLTGGSVQKYTYFDQPILNAANIRALRKLSSDIKSRLPAADGVDSSGPYDIELGFKDEKIWLFQIRPFVENKSASGALYLESLNPDLSHSRIIDLFNP